MAFGKTFLHVLPEWDNAKRKTNDNFNFQLKSFHPCFQKNEIQIQMNTDNVAQLNENFHAETQFIFYTLPFTKGSAKIKNK